ncbi:retinoid-inducible serine carboxypeptidase-like [Colias croceus]|uniref:retinoid-inducible serine carboxypeptidase-like n=1 Tax=Colias crocea TaxID=72248 RepID=UPI001E27A61D|nr:retinoid-inducible serine carboxypeptidase-like [Colias croceus]
MKSLIFISIVRIFVLALCDEQNPYLEALRDKPWKSVHRYVEVRPGAFLFYWFYYADGTMNGAEQKPLIIWIQGGPGNTASGIGNFCEIGPLTMDMTPRNHTWVRGRNVLLIDHPVGTGFSYALNKSLYVKTDRDAARDLLRAIKVFLKFHKEFRKTPTYIIGQSYGGKLSARLGFYLHLAIKNKHLKMNLKGIGIGSGWIDTKESSIQQPRYLYDMGLIDIKTYNKAMNIAKNISYLISIRHHAKAAEYDHLMFQTFINDTSTEINLENINKYSNYWALHDLSLKVNLYVKPTLAVNQSIVWTYISHSAYYGLKNDFVLPGTKFLETLLNRTKLRIVVFNGNLDAVTPLSAATNWVHNLKWYGAKKFMESTRIPIRGQRNGFYKSYDNFSFWAVFGSGHWVPEDNPTAMEEILEYLTRA